MQPCIDRSSVMFGACVSYGLPGTSRPHILETLSTEQMNSDHDIVQDSTTRILQMDERRGPLLVHFNETQWSMVKDVFRETENGRNPPPGWNVWRIYIIDTSGYFLPVLLKHFTSTKTMRYRVSKDWILYEPINEILALFIFRKFILQTRMSRQLVGLVI